MICSRRRNSELRRELAKINQRVSKIETKSKSPNPKGRKKKKTEEAPWKHIHFS
jgi:hypothetical protein